jgi:hypothetical protein
MEGEDMFLLKGIAVGTAICAAPAAIANEYVTLTNGSGRALKIGLGEPACAVRVVKAGEQGDAAAGRESILKEAKDVCTLGPGESLLLSLETSSKSEAGQRVNLILTDLSGEAMGVAFHVHYAPASVVHKDRQYAHFLETPRSSREQACVRIEWDRLTVLEDPKVPKRRELAAAGRMNLTSRGLKLGRTENLNLE